MKSIYRISALAAVVLLAGCQTPAQSPQRTQAAPTVAQPAPPQPTQSSVDFRLGQTTAAQGLSELKLSGGSLWLVAQPVMTKSDLSAVEPRQTAQGQAYVRLQFNEAGAQKLTAINSQFAGKLLAITINNVLVAAPVIQKEAVKGILDVPFENSAQAVSAARSIAN